MNCPLFRIVVSIIAILVGTCAEGQSGRSTEGTECSELRLGQSAQYRTKTISSKSKHVHAYATIEVTRALSDTKAQTCRVRYSLFVSDGAHPFAVAKAFTATSESMVGAEVIGFSKNQSKLAADFWWAAGDYTGHRPVIYDVITKRIQFRELDEQITGQLPSCDYFQLFTGVSDSGEAIIHVPKSIYVDEGCPDQGDWLFNVSTGRVGRRVTQR